MEWGVWKVTEIPATRASRKLGPRAVLWDRGWGRMPPPPLPPSAPALILPPKLQGPSLQPQSGRGKKKARLKETPRRARASSALPPGGAWEASFCPGQRRELVLTFGN